jgi:hypothetical protein
MLLEIKEALKNLGKKVDGVYYHINLNGNINAVTDGGLTFGYSPTTENWFTI